MVTISAAVRQVKDDLQGLLEPHVNQALQAYSDYAWRDRVLGPLATTLTDAEAYSAAELAEQYDQRWRIEENFRHLKQTMNMDVLKCKTPEGVLKEMAVFTLVYNLVRLVMLYAAGKQGVAVDRLSFVDALRWLRDAIGDPATMTLLVNPDRRGRIEPRVKKRRPKQYPLMTQPRDELRQALQSTTITA